MQATRIVEALALRPRDLIVEGTRKPVTISRVETIGNGVGKTHVTLTNKSTWVYDAHAHVEIAA